MTADEAPAFMASLGSDRAIGPDKAIGSRRAVLLKAVSGGGGLGVFKPEEVAPVDVQVPNSIIDILAGDEAEAVSVEKKYVSNFQGRISDWTRPDSAGCGMSCRRTGCGSMISLR